MKSVIMSVIFFLCFASLYAQDKTAEWGVKAGANFATFTVRGRSNDGDFSTSLKPYAGMFFAYNVNSVIMGKLELTYSGQGSKYENLGENIKETTYSIPYVSLAYYIGFRLKYIRIEGGLTTDFALNKDMKIPNQKTFDIGGALGVELFLFPQVSLEGRIKGGYGYVNGSTGGEKPFNRDLSNVVYQVGINYYLK